MSRNYFNLSLFIIFARNLVGSCRLKGSVKEYLAGKIPSEHLSLIYRSYDLIGDIAVIRVPEEASRYKRLIAEAIMHVHKHVKSVWAQVSPVSGDFRLRELEWIAGEKRSETVYKEYGCIFKVDLKRCYFSPRLSYERMRIAKLVQPKETVVNMFAGVGCYSIMIAKHSDVEKVFSMDINPYAVEYMKENIRLNKVEGKVIPILGDAKKVVEEKLQKIADRVLMPLPEKAYEFIEVAIQALKPKGGWIHYYSFEHARKNEDPIEKAKLKVMEKFEELGINFNVAFGRVVRGTGPNWYQIVLDIKVKL